MTETRTLPADLSAGELGAPGKSLWHRLEPTILGSASIVTQLMEAGLVDELQLVVHPVLLGEGQTMFAGMKELRKLNLMRTRAFKNGVIVSSYAPAKS